MWANKFRDYAANTSGNIAIMTSLGLGFLLLGVGAAIDFSSVSKRNNDLQNFADAAVLAAAKSRADDEDELRAIVETVVNSHNTEGWPLTINVIVTDDDIAVDLGTDYNTMLMGMVGTEELPVQVLSKAPRARLTPINLAIVVDTTDSMQGDNIAALKTAANALIDEMDALEAETRISLVPFGQYVNVGVSQGTPGSRSWIDMGQYGQSYQHCWEPRITVTAPTCTVTGTETYNHIVDGRNMGVRTRDVTQCTGGVYETGPEQCEMRTYDWHGCMGSRNGENNTRARVNGYRVPAALDEHCGSEMTPLTSNFEDLKTVVDGLTTSGPTYLPSGLIWGWRSLDAQQPYIEAASSTDPNLKRAMVFMTDGVNTRSQGDGWNSTNGAKHRNTADNGEDGLEVTEDLCENIAAEQIEIFVVAYQLPDSGETGEVLEDCATTPSHYFTPENAGELLADFREIASLLDYTRLSY